MKNITFLKKTIAILLLCACSASASAVEYCHSTVTTISGGASGTSFYLTCRNTGGNNYEVIVEADVQMLSAGNNMYVRLNGGTATNIGQYAVFSPDKKTCTMAFTSTAAPYDAHGQLGFVFGTANNWGYANWPAGIDWSATCGGSSTPDEESPVMSSASFVSATATSALINVAATDNVAVTKYVAINVNSPTDSTAYTPSAGQITIAGLSPTSPYTFRIRAKDDAGNVSANAITLAEFYTTADIGVLIDDFEGAVRGWGNAGNSGVPTIVENPYSNSDNSSANVLLSSRTTGNDNWSGPFLTAAQYSAGGFPATGYQYVHVLMYRNNANPPNLKISDNRGGDIVPMYSIVANRWQDVVFNVQSWAIDFIMIMIDRTGAGTMYIDDVLLSNSPTPRIDLGGGTGGDLSAPTNFSASYDNLTSISVELIMQANDDSGTVIYELSGQDNTASEAIATLPSSLQGNSGQVVRHTLTGLTPNHYYSVTIMPTDEAGNINESEDGYKILDFNTPAIDNDPPTNFTATLGSVSHNKVELLLNATDALSDIYYTVTYTGLANPITATSPSGTQKSVSISGLIPETPYEFSITAKDASDNEAANSPLTVNATTDAAPVSTMCSGESNEASQGNFTTGYYIYNISTQGTTVNISIELVDDNRTMTNAYLWNYSGTPFETPMTYNPQTKTATGTLAGQTIGANISFAVKFAYAGGMVVTKTFPYTVGDNCLPVPPDDEEDPENFTATQGAVTNKTIAINLNATDNSGYVLYEITGNFPTSPQTVQGTSGEATSFNATGLTPSTEYNFSVTAKDVTGNIAANSPITLQITTAEGVVNTECNGESNVTLEGAPFSYGYAFSTSGTTVNISIELFDNFTGVNAYFHDLTTGELVESGMAYDPNTKIATKTLAGQTIGADVIFKVKFAYAGGMSVTKLFTYTVGDDCTTDIKAPKDFSAAINDAAVTHNSVEFILNATDNSGSVIYVINGDFPESPLEISAASGVETIYVLHGLSPATNYVFSVSVKDASENTNVEDVQLLWAETLPAPPDVTPPTDFTAQTGEVTATTIEILLNSADESNCVTYEFIYQNEMVNCICPDTVKFESVPAGATSFTIENLIAESQYSILVNVKDCEGNAGTTGADTITLSATTLTSGLNEIFSENLIIYPNPVNSELKILNYELKENEKIEIFDVSGRVVGTMHALPLRETLTINVSALPQGIYFIKIETKTAKFIKK
ncbi:MAG: T9SS type A sorting domain-containing protein [Prevotellaceae bacterium]|jgi:chitodextrinase|nr:T9SS type A sorting domain-containing protein [Prevotellaceae bacterium]